MSKRGWMDVKTITLNKVVNGKPIKEEVTVNKFIEMYNVQQVVFERTTDYAQALMGQLFLKDPGNPFFTSCGKVILDFAKKRAEEIKENPSLGMIPEPKKMEEVTPEVEEQPKGKIIPADFTTKDESEEEETF